MILDGKQVADKIKLELKEEINLLDPKPCLAVILVGEDPASKVYVNMKKIACEKIGIISKKYQFNTDVTEQELIDLIAELNDNELIVIGMPMYNFGIPSTFKAWIDRIARAGITFKYTEQGAVGLIKDKKVVVLAARGGVYQGTDMDTQTKYLKDVLGFVGMTDVNFIYAEGLAMPGAEQSLEAAQNEIKAFTASL